jgi:hypothetical protein
VPCSWLWMIGLVLGAAVGAHAAISFCLDPGSPAPLVVAPAAPFFGWMALRSMLFVSDEAARPGVWWEAKPVALSEVRGWSSEGSEIYAQLVSGGRSLVAVSPAVFDLGNERALRRIRRATERESDEARSGPD